MSRLPLFSRPCIRERKPYVPGRSIADVEARYHPPRIVKLGSNENPWGPSEKAMEAFIACAKGLHLYPDGASRVLRQALARLHGLDDMQIVVGNGSDEVLLFIAMAFLNPGDKVLVSESTFSEYEYSARMMDARVVRIPLKDMRYSLEGFAAEAEGARMVFLCNPNNPTGNHFTEAELEGLFAVLPETCLVVVDEAYADFAEAEDFPASTDLLSREPRLLVTRTLSKLYGLAALRIGYALGHPDLIADLYRVKTPFNVNQPAQAAAVAALDDRDFVRKTLGNNAREKQRLRAALAGLGLRCLPSEANFLCFASPLPATLLCEDLLRDGLIIRALHSFDLPDWCRVTVGRPEENDFFLDRLADRLRSLAPPA